MPYANAELQVDSERGVAIRAYFDWLVFLDQLNVTEEERREIWLEAKKVASAAWESIAGLLESEGNADAARTPNDTALVRRQDNLRQMWARGREETFSLGDNTLIWFAFSRHQT